MKAFAKGIAAVLAAAVFGSAASAQTTLTVGSKNFTEQFIVAELYAASLESAGFKVVRKINLGATLVAHEAVRTGAIDLYPEYTGTGVTAVMKVQGATETDPQTPLTDGDVLAQSVASSPISGAMAGVTARVAVLCPEQPPRIKV